MNLVYAVAGTDVMLVPNAHLRPSLGDLVVLATGTYTVASVVWFPAADTVRVNLVVVQ